MHVSPIRMPLSEAIWQAHQNTPIVIWNAKESRWLVITYAGWFTLRIADGDHPTHRVTISRSQLAEMLGLGGVHDVVEAGIVQPERPAHGMSSHGDHGAHGGEHAHASPVQRFLGLLRAEKQDIWTLLIFSVFAGILYWPRHSRWMPS